MTNDGVLDVNRLGMLYAIYRGVVAAILLLVYFFDFLVLEDHYTDVDWYFSILVAYTILTIFQLLSFVSFGNGIKQIMWMGLVDVVCLGAIHYSIGHASMQVGLLFVVTIFVLNLVQTKKNGVLLTLGSVISVVYLPFVENLFYPGASEHILNTALLTIMFVVVYALANFAARHYQLLEKINRDKTAKLEQIQDIAYRIMLNVDTGYLVLNEHHELLLINDVARRALAIEQEFSLSEINSEFVRNYLARISKRDNTGTFVCSLNGVEYFIWVQKLGQGQGLSLITMEDSTKLNERLHNLKLAALGQISASVAHEIRNPLSIIVQAVDLIFKADVAKKARYCSIIQRQCNRIDGIIQSTLDIAKNHKLHPMNLSLDEVLTTLVAEDLMDIESKIRINGECDLIILFDDLHFRQVMTNLIRNAVRHNNFDVSPFIEVGLSSVGEQVVIDVVDFGEGVSADHLGNLFTPFFSTESTGTGLGLFLVKNLCESNHAFIEYVQRDLGACFRITCLKASIDSTNELNTFDKRFFRDE